MILPPVPISNDFKDWAESLNRSLSQSNIITGSNVPSSATDAGRKGQLAFDGSFLYVCIDTDTWVRAAVATW